MLEEESDKRLTEVDQSSQVGIAIRSSGYRFLPDHGQTSPNRVREGLPATLKLPAKLRAEVIYFFSVSNHLITIDCSSMRRSEKL